MVSTTCRVDELVSVGLKRADALQIANLENAVKEASGADRFLARIRVKELQGTKKAEAIRQAARENPDDHQLWVESLRGKPMQTISL